MPPASRTPPPLWLQLAWFVRLRWLAGGAVILGGVAGLYGLHSFGHGPHCIATGGAILAYNAFLALVMRRPPAVHVPRWRLLALAWAQIVSDLLCLTLLTLWTGGTASPLKGFYVLHMVFASLLLPRFMAYIGAGIAIVLLETGLLLTDSWQRTREAALGTLAWAAMLLLIVHLTNHITAGLRRQRRRLILQNHRIRAMTQRLRVQQQAMVQQEKMAAVGRMAAGVAHEVGNPLASMDSLLQLMERRPEKLRPEAIPQLRLQIQRIYQTVRQMTNFAHPDPGQWEHGNVNQAVERALEVLRFDPRWKQVQVDRHLAQEVPEIPMLPTAVQQVIVNLVINALDAMEGIADPRLTLRTKHWAGQCEIEITDNGHGITAEIREHLFEPFFTTKPVGKGTGLGLSISYSLIRKHGGDIRVASPAGQGASFVIQLPASKPTAPPAGPPPGPPPLPAASHPREAGAGGFAIPENPTT